MCHSSFLSFHSSFSCPPCGLGRAPAFGLELPLEPAEPLALEPFSWFWEPVFTWPLPRPSLWRVPSWFEFGGLFRAGAAAAELASLDSALGFGAGWLLALRLDSAGVGSDDWVSTNAGGLFHTLPPLGLGGTKAGVGVGAGAAAGVDTGAGAVAGAEVAAGAGDVAGAAAGSTGEAGVVWFCGGCRVGDGFFVTCSVLGAQLEWTWQWSWLLCWNPEHTCLQLLPLIIKLPKSATRHRQEAWLATQPYLEGQHLDHSTLASAICTLWRSKKCSSALHPTFLLQFLLRSIDRRLQGLQGWRSFAWSSNIPD